MAKGETLLIFMPGQVLFPSSNHPQLGTRNQRPYLAFDPDTDETCYFEAVMAANYAGGTIIVRIHTCNSAAPTGSDDWIWVTAFEKMDGLDIDGDSFDTENSTESDSGLGKGFMKIASDEVAVANLDGIAAGDAFRMKFYRDADHVDDASDADIELYGIELREWD